MIALDSQVKNTYDDLEKLVTLVANGNHNSLLTTGTPGTGKSKTIISTLDSLNKKENVDYIIRSGRITPIALYQILYENQDKIIIFDDCDSILLNDTCADFLKKATADTDPRRISYETKDGATFNPEGMRREQMAPLLRQGKTPNIFTFTGKIIIITNLNKEKIDSALRSRSLYLELSLNRDEMITRIKQILHNLQPTVSLNLKQQLIDFVIEKNIVIDIRKFNLAIKVIASGVDDWKRLVVKYIE